MVQHKIPQAGTNTGNGVDESRVFYSEPVDDDAVAFHATYTMFNAHSLFCLLFIDVFLLLG